MDKLKKVIIILIIFIFIIVMLILRLKSQIKNDERIYNQHNIGVVTETGFSEIEDYTTYYTIKEIINNYIVYMKQVNGDQYIEKEKLDMTEDEINKALQEEGITAIKSILDKQYIENMSINDDLIKSAQNKYRQNGNYDKDVIYNLNIEEIVKTYINENITLVLVNSKLNDIELNMLIKLDKINNTHSIFLEDYMKEYNYSKDMSKEDINVKEDEIEANNYNSHIKVEASEAYIVSQYFSEYRIKMLNDTEKAYELLDTEYKQEKFGSYEKFKNYVDSNQQKILYASISKYQVNENDGVKEYVCIDNNGKYYIFMESTITDYNVILDTYTTDLPEFLDKYNKNDDEIKAGMNIQKIFDTMNDEDYSYAYKKLDSTFKQNNFPTEESFKNYAEQYFSNNQLKYDDCTKSGELYVYDITVNEEDENSTKKTFIIKLLEGTDYVFSFNIQ